MIEAMPVARQAALKWDDLVFDPGPFLTANAPEPFYVSALGALYSDDCMAILPFVRPSVVDTVFADPPFNLGKEYGTRSNDDLSDTDYLNWCKIWIGECARTLKPGGSFFLYNLPKWNVLLGAYLSDLGLTFRHWIAIEISACLPIPGRLHPSHYSLLYYSKGKPKTFRRIEHRFKFVGIVAAKLRTMVDIGGR